MRIRLVLLLALGGVGVAALFAVQQIFDARTVTADDRVVQAPPLPSAGGDPAAGEHPSHGEAPSAQPGGAQQVAGTSGTAVGFTVVGGRFYLVTANDASAVAAYASAVARGGASFRCGQSAQGTSPFTAWELRGQGGSGALPPMSPDGGLLTASPDGARLACTVPNA
ncbi:hypothetical protein [Saccharothrix coeruleofusca]|uniref:Uncharacterized protein n=1 Tax=Saccharothrix coeruleofusca TaxID=33919 RepID=A0A918APV8_9PSEU|nr:hypothetical protein [Saccharothrix coeruleofusca]MBP2334949.1 hypothetical protein [Saccharothrix coeruleofusca]GGP68132.1 hypothetical protein GCM10010185_46180 [Saccharothrix coeruleofusca]